MIRILTDSACDILPAEAQQLGVTVIPLNVTLEDGTVLRDGVDMTPSAYYEILAGCRKLPTTSQRRRRPAAPAGAAADDGNSSSDPAASAAQSSAARPNVFQNAAVSCFSFTHSPPIGGHCTTSAPICASHGAVLRKCEEIFAQTIDFFPLYLV